MKQKTKCINCTRYSFIDRHCDACGWNLGDREFQPYFPNEGDL